MLIYGREVRGMEVITLEETNSSKRHVVVDQRKINIKLEGNDIDQTNSNILDRGEMKINVKQAPTMVNVGF